FKLGFSPLVEPGSLKRGAAVADGQGKSIERRSLRIRAYGDSIGLVGAKLVNLQRHLARRCVFQRHFDLELIGAGRLEVNRLRGVRSFAERNVEATLCRFALDMQLVFPAYDQRGLVSGNYLPLAGHSGN